MQSKWLSWQPGSVGFVGSSRRRNSIIQSNDSTDNGVPGAFTALVIENYPQNLPSKPTKPPPLDSAYAVLVGQSMHRVAEICPPDALRWAREAHPALTDKIDAEIIVRLDALWSNHAPLAEFEAALDELVRLHGDVAKLFCERSIEEEAEPYHVRNRRKRRIDQDGMSA